MPIGTVNQHDLGWFGAGLMYEFKEDRFRFDSSVKNGMANVAWVIPDIGGIEKLGG